MPEPRRTFAPVLGLGVAAGILAAVAGNRTWVVDTSLPPGSDPLRVMAEAGEMPVFLALSLVVLACWGVILVTRGVLRRGVALLALLAAGGLVATLVAGTQRLPEQVVDAFSGPRPTDVITTEQTGWFYAAAVAAALCVLTTAAAVRWVAHWPEMGSRYDAPGATAQNQPDEDQTSLDLWKSIDEGRDPTV